MCPPPPAPGRLDATNVALAFAKLACGGAKQMLAGQRRFSMNQRHHVLQLVAKTVSAAGLIKAGAAQSRQLNV